MLMEKKSELEYSSCFKANLNIDEDTSIVFEDDFRKLLHSNYHGHIKLQNGPTSTAVLLHLKSYVDIFNDT